MTRTVTVFGVKCDVPDVSDARAHVKFTHFQDGSVKIVHRPNYRLSGRWRIAYRLHTDHGDVAVDGVGSTIGVAVRDVEQRARDLRALFVKATVRRGAGGA